MKLTATAVTGHPADTLHLRRLWPAPAHIANSQLHESFPAAYAPSSTTATISHQKEAGWFLAMPATLLIPMDSSSPFCCDSFLHYCGE